MTPEYFQYFAYVYVAPIFYALGYLGCFANLITLSDKQFSTRIYTYLRALSFADLWFITLVIPCMTHLLKDEEGKANVDDKSTMRYHIYIEVPLTNGFSAASVFIVLCMTIDR